MVVRGHDCVVKRVAGIPFRVTGFVAPQEGGWFCNDCCTESAGPNEMAATGLWGGHMPISWLIRIDPPALTESITEREGIAA